MSLIRDTFFSGASTVVLTASRFAVTILLIRALPPSVYGDFAFAQWLIDIVFLVCSFGIPGAATRFLSAAPDPAAAARRTILLATASALVSVTAFAICLIWMDDWRNGGSALIVFASAYLLNSYTTPILQGLFRFRAVLIGNLCFAVAGPVLVLTVALRPTLSHAALALGGAWIISSCAAIVAAKRAGGLPAIGGQGPTREKVTGYALNVWLIGLVASLVWSRGEMGLLKGQVDSVEFAHYAAALSLAGLVYQAAGLFTGALTPHLARQIEREDSHGVDRTLRTIGFVMLTTTSAAALALMSAGDLISGGLLGKAYIASSDVAALLSIAAVAICSGPANTVLQVTTNGRFGLVMNLVGLAVLLGFSAALIPLLGVSGAAVGRIAAQCIVGFTTLILLRSHAGLRRTSRDMSVAFAVTLCGLVALYLAQDHLPAWARLAAAAPAGLAILVFNSKMLGIKPREAWRLRGAL